MPSRLGVKSSSKGRKAASVLFAWLVGASFVAAQNGVITVTSPSGRYTAHFGPKFEQADLPSTVARYLSDDEIYAGSSYTVEFEALGGVTGPYDIDLYRGDGKTTAFCSVSEGCDVENGSITVSIMRTLASGSGYYIVVTERSSSVTGSSDVFELLPAPETPSPASSGTEFQEVGGGGGVVGDMNTGMFVLAAVCGLLLVGALLTACICSSRRRDSPDKSNKGRPTNTAGDLESGTAADHSSGDNNVIGDRSSDSESANLDAEGILPAKAEASPAHSRPYSSGGSLSQATINKYVSPGRALARGDRQRGRSLSRGESLGRRSGSRDRSRSEAEDGTPGRERRRMYSLTPGRDQRRSRTPSASNASNTPGRDRRSRTHSSVTPGRDRLRMYSTTPKRDRDRGGDGSGESGMISAADPRTPKRFSTPGRRSSRGRQMSTKSSSMPMESNSWDMVAGARKFSPSPIRDWGYGHSSRDKRRSRTVDGVRPPLHGQYSGDFGGRGMPPLSRQDSRTGEILNYRRSMSTERVLVQQHRQYYQREPEEWEMEVLRRRAVDGGRMSEASDIEIRRGRGRTPREVLRKSKSAQDADGRHPEDLSRIEGQKDRRAIECKRARSGGRRGRAEEGSPASASSRHNTLRRSGMTERKSSQDVSWEEMRFKYERSKARFNGAATHTPPSYNEVTAISTAGSFSGGEWTDDGGGSGSISGKRSAASSSAYDNSSIGQDLNGAIPRRLQQRQDSFTSAHSARSSNPKSVGSTKRSHRSFKSGVTASPGTRAVNARKAARDAQLSAEKALAAAAAASHAADAAARAAIEAELEADVEGASELGDGSTEPDHFGAAVPSSYVPPPTTPGSSIRDKIRVFDANAKSASVISTPEGRTSVEENPIVKPRGSFSLKSQSGSKTSVANAVHARPDDSWFAGNTRDPDMAGGSVGGSSEADGKNGASATSGIIGPRLLSVAGSAAATKRARRQAFVRQYSGSIQAAESNVADVPQVNATEPNNYPVVARRPYLSKDSGLASFDDSDFSLGEGHDVASPCGRLPTVADENSAGDQVEATTQKRSSLDRAPSSEPVDRRYDEISATVKNMSEAGSDHEYSQVF